MKVSIITATYNSAEQVKNCLHSLNSQSYTMKEHIIIDGASTDSTLDVISELSPNSLIQSERDNGIYDALNKGVKIASGDIIGFLHSDDQFYNHETLTNVVDFIISHDLDGVYGDLVYTTSSGTILRHWTAGKYFENQLRKGWMPPHPTLFLKREVYEKIGEYNLNYKISSDYDFMLRLFQSEKFKIGYFPHVITRMCIGGASNGSLSQILQKMKEDLTSIRENNVGGLSTLFQKNIRKVPQLFKR